MKETFNHCYFRIKCKTKISFDTWNIIWASLFTINHHYIYLALLMISLICLKAYSGYFKSSVQQCFLTFSFFLFLFFKLIQKKQLFCFFWINFVNTNKNSLVTYPVLVLYLTLDTRFISTENKVTNIKKRQVFIFSLARISFLLTYTCYFDKPKRA